MHAFTLNAPVRLADLPVSVGPLSGLLLTARDHLCALAEIGGRDVVGQPAHGRVARGQ